MSDDGEHPPGPAADQQGTGDPDQDTATHADEGVDPETASDPADEGSGGQSAR